MKAAAKTDPDRVAALRVTPVSRETAARLDEFVALFRKWQRAVQLVAPSTLPKLWTRHIADSLQLLDLAPRAKTWADLGSGGGFPGMVIAIALAGKPGAAVHLIESDGRKAAFLREAVRIGGAPATVHARRAETVAQELAGKVEVVTARAFAPLPRLLPLAEPLLSAGARGLFPKGRDLERELGAVLKTWEIEFEIVPSRTDAHGKILVVERALLIRPHPPRPEPVS